MLKEKGLKMDVKKTLMFGNDSIQLTTTDGDLLEIKYA